MKTRGTETIKRKGWIVSVLIFVAFIFTPMLCWANAPAPEVADYLRDKWGIEIISLRGSAGNYMLDFRYRVLDADKAEPLFRRKSRPQLIDQGSGVQLGVYSSPKTGPLRTTNKPQAGRNYFMLFANPGRYIQAGNQVTIKIDNFKVENLVVQ